MIKCVKIVSNIDLLIFIHNRRINEPLFLSLNNICCASNQFTHDYFLFVNNIIKLTTSRTPDRDITNKKMN